MKIPAQEVRAAILNNAHLNGVYLGGAHIVLKYTILKNDMPVTVKCIRCDTESSIAFDSLVRSLNHSHIKYDEDGNPVYACGNCSNDLKGRRLATRRIIKHETKIETPYHDMLDFVDKHFPIRKTGEFWAPS